MVEQNTGACEHIVCLAVLLHNPEAVEFRHRIGAVRMKRCFFILRHFLHFAIKFGSGGLIEAACFRESTLADSFQEAEHTGGIHVGGKFRGIE